MAGDELSALLQSDIDARLPTDSGTPQPAWLVFRLANPDAPVVTLSRDHRLQETRVPVFFVASGGIGVVERIARELYDATGGLGRLWHMMRGDRTGDFMMIPHLYHTGDSEEDFRSAVSAFLSQRADEFDLAWVCERCVVYVSHGGESYRMPDSKAPDPTQRLVSSSESVQPDAQDATAGRRMRGPSLTSRLADRLRQAFSRRELDGAGAERTDAEKLEVVRDVTWVIGPPGAPDRKDSYAAVAKVQGWTAEEACFNIVSTFLRSFVEIRDGARSELSSLLSKLSGAEVTVASAMVTYHLDLKGKQPALHVRSEDIKSADGTPLREARTPEFYQGAADALGYILKAEWVRAEIVYESR